MSSYHFLFHMIRIFSCILCATTISASSISWIDCSQNVPPPATFLNVTGVNLKSLPSTLHCGQIVVPMDYSNPACEGNNITLGLAMYRPKSPKGVIFFSPGGTDAGAAAAWRVALGQKSDYWPDFSGLLDYDLMMLDIRGTWSSNKLNASLEAVGGVTGPFPTNQSDFDAIVAASRKLIQSFDDLSSPPGFVKFAGTKEVVQDFEMIRAALGYEKIHFLGLSYGSYRAQQYAARYPGRVGNFVLDAVAPPGLSLFDQANSSILAQNRALLRSDAYCQNDVNCALKSQGRGIIPKVFGELLASVSNSSSDTFQLQFVLDGLLQNQPVFPVINQALYELANGNSSAFGSGSSEYTIDAVVGIPYLCSDYEIEDNTWAGFDKSLRAGAKLDTYNIGQAAAWNTRMYCAGWPYATNPLKMLHLKAPMLFVTADFDASTPTEWATFAWESASNSALLVRHGDDHTTFNLPESRATSLEKEFLRTGILPPVQNGTEVTVYHAGMHRVPIPDPYNVPTGLIAGDCPDPDICNLQ